MIKKQSYSVQYFVVLAVAYTILNLLIPLSRDTRNAYNLSLAQAHIISFIAVLPLLAVWFVAFYCYGQLQKYAQTVKKGREGAAFQKVADGVMVLSWGLVIQTFASLILGGLADQYGGFRGAATVLQNYTTLIFPLVAFTLISSGTYRLLVDKHNPNSISSNRILILLFAVIAAVYSYLILHLRRRLGYDPYHLPTFWLIITIVIPYLFAWFSGLIAAFDISQHARVTKGLLYKRSLKLLSVGLVMLIVVSILVQYLNSVFVSVAGGVSINAVLLIDYVLLFGVALSYAIMLAGVRGLQKIEEI